MSGRGGVAMLVAVAIAIGGCGLVAEWAAYGPGGHLAGSDSTYPWILDLLTGWALLGCGVLVARRRASSLVGPLFLLASIAWFAATLIEPRRDIGTALAPSVVFLYRGFLAQIIVTFPTGRPADLVEWLAVGLGYATSLLAPVWYSPAAGMVTVGLLVAVAWRNHRGARGWSKRARQDALAVAGAAAVTVVVLTVGRALRPPYPFEDVMTIGFHVAIVAGAIHLATRLAGSEQLAITDLVVDLGASPSGTLGGQLALLLDDPTVRVGTWSRTAGAYLDETGRALAETSTLPERGRVRIDQDGDPLALVEHERGTLDDPELRLAVTDAVRLAAVNARLRTQVRSQVAELAASRRRLIVAEDDAGERLAQRLRDGAIPHLDTVGERLASAARTAREHAPSGEADHEALTSVISAIDRSRLRLGRARDDLRDLAFGLDPRALAAAGLAGGLEELVRECPLPVDLRVDPGYLPSAVATDAYLVCAEALTNIVRHAKATRVHIRAIIQARELCLEVTDDGVGGATLRSGSGFDTMSPDLTLAGAADGFGRAARVYDLAVVRQPQPDKPGPEELIAEGAMFGAGRPVLVVPYVQKDGLKLDRVTVCWDGGRAASRAVSDALPFLSKAKKVEVLIVQKKSAPSDELPGALMAQHLARHNLNVELRTMLVPELDVASAILSHVADNSTDLLVMGGYGHSRLREFVLGGVTRNILASMTVPTLMSH